MDVVKITLLCLSLSLTACGPAPDMPNYASPLIESTSESVKLEVLDPKDEIIFYLLPLNGQVFAKKTLWSGAYWPSSLGGINQRWNLQSLPAERTSPNWVEAFLMSQDELAQLSPTEKFDLFQGRYDYPLKAEVSTFTGENLREGMVVASTFYHEPIPKTLSNSEGIQVPFGSSDIKALLSYYYQNHQDLSHVPQLGIKSKLDPGSFHVVLANKVALKNVSFIVDIQRDGETLYMPVKSFASRVEEEREANRSSPAGATRILKMRTKVSYIAPLLRNTWEPVIGTPGQSVIIKEYSYELFLNYKNEIIAGHWLSEEQPDSLWIPEKLDKFQGPLENLSALLDD